MIKKTISAWREMESAPKNGSLVLVRDDCGRIFSAEYKESSYGGQVGHFWCAPDPMEYNSPCILDNDFALVKWAKIPA